MGFNSKYLNTLNMKYVIHIQTRPILISCFIKLYFKFLYKYICIDMIMMKIRYFMLLCNLFLYIEMFYT
jgi:hypothetical protein